MHGNQVLVNAHIMLANAGADAYVLNVDTDEYLVTNHRTTLPELFDGCFRNQTALLPRCGSYLYFGSAAVQCHSLSALGLVL